MPLFMEKRFPVLIILLFFIFSIYTIEIFVIQGSNELKNDDLTYQDSFNPTLNETAVEAELNANSGDIFALFGFIFNFLTFQYLEMPFPALLVLNFINLIVIVTRNIYNYKYNI